MSFFSRIGKSKTFLTGLVSIGAGVLDFLLFGGALDVGAKGIIFGAGLIFGRDSIAKVSEKIDKAQETVKNVNDIVDGIQESASSKSTEAIGFTVDPDPDED